MFDPSLFGEPVPLSDEERFAGAVATAPTPPPPDHTAEFANAVAPQLSALRLPQDDLDAIRAGRPLLDAHDRASALKPVPATVPLYQIVSEDALRSRRRGGSIDVSLEDAWLDTPVPVPPAAAPAPLLDAHDRAEALRRPSPSSGGFAPQVGELPQPLGKPSLIRNVLGPGGDVAQAFEGAQQFAKAGAAIAHIILNEGVRRRYERLVQQYAEQTGRDPSDPFVRIAAGVTVEDERPDAFKIPVKDIVKRALPGGALFGSVIPDDWAIGEKGISELLFDPFNLVGGVGVERALLKGAGKAVGAASRAPGAVLRGAEAAVVGRETAGLGAGYLAKYVPERVTAGRKAPKPEIPPEIQRRAAEVGLDPVTLQAIEQGDFRVIREGYGIQKTPDGYFVKHADGAAVNRPTSLERAVAGLDAVAPPPAAAARAPEATAAIPSDAELSKMTFPQLKKAAEAVGIPGAANYRRGRGAAGTLRVLIREAREAAAEAPKTRPVRENDGSVFTYASRESAIEAARTGERQAGFGYAPPPKGTPDVDPGPWAKRTTEPGMESGVRVQPEPGPQARAGAKPTLEGRERTGGLSTETFGDMSAADLTRAIQATTPHRSIAAFAKSVREGRAAAEGAPQGLIDKFLRGEVERALLAQGVDPGVVRQILAGLSPSSLPTHTPPVRTGASGAAPTPSAPAAAASSPAAAAPSPTAAAAPPPGAGGPPSAPAAAAAAAPTPGGATPGGPAAAAGGAGAPPGGAPPTGGAGGAGAPPPGGGKGGKGKGAAAGGTPPPAGITPERVTALKRDVTKMWRDDPDQDLVAALTNKHTGLSQTDAQKVVDRWNVEREKARAYAYARKIHGLGVDDAENAQSLVRAGLAPDPTTAADIVKRALKPTPFVSDWERAANAAGLFKTTFSAGDVSGAGRQARAFISHPRIFASEFKRSLATLFGQDKRLGKSFADYEMSLFERLARERWDEAGLPFRSLESYLRGGDEAFPSGDEIVKAVQGRLGIPGKVWGKVIQNSNEAYVSMLNGVAARTALDWSDQMRHIAGRDLTMREKRDLAAILRHGTGRLTSTSVSEKATAVRGAMASLNFVFFSPELRASRVAFVKDVAEAVGRVALRSPEITRAIARGSRAPMLEAGVRPADIESIRLGIGMVTSSVVLYAMSAQAMGIKSIDLRPGSTNFMRVDLGEYGLAPGVATAIANFVGISGQQYKGRAYIDLTNGISQEIRTLHRALTGEFIGADGKPEKIKWDWDYPAGKVPPGALTRNKILWQYVSNGFSPAFGGVTDFFGLTRSDWTDMLDNPLLGTLVFGIVGDFVQASGIPYPGRTEDRPSSSSRGRSVAPVGVPGATPRPSAPIPAATMRPSASAAPSSGAWWR